MNEAPTKSAVRRAGVAIRAYQKGAGDIELLKVQMDTLTRYRKSFMEPMEEVHKDLSGIIKNSAVEAELTYRLKKLSTIVEKLSRESGLELDRMHDYGGCRAVVSGRSELDRLRACIADSLEVKREYDYITFPRSSGYRAVHVIVAKDS